MDRTELFSRTATGEDLDARRWEALVEVFDRWRRSSLGATLGTEDAEDFAHALALELLGKRWGPLLDHPAPIAQFRRLIRSRYVDRYRMAEVRVRLVALPLQNGEPMEFDQRLEHRLNEQEETCIGKIDALSFPENDLPRVLTEQERLLILARAEGASSVEIGRALGTEPHEVDQIAHRVRRKLAAAWAKKIEASSRNGETTRQDEAREARAGRWTKPTTPQLADMKT